MFSPECFSTVDGLLRKILSEAQFDLSFEVFSFSENPQFRVIFDGPDVPYLLARNAELLLALEHVAAKAIRLEPEQHDFISFDEEGFKAKRERMIARRAQDAVELVRASGSAYRFGPMTSRERRLLHLALAPYGLVSRSEGEGASRHLVVHPELLTALAS
jgi:spoIIIJ-associated protein